MLEVQRRGLSRMEAYKIAEDYPAICGEANDGGRLMLDDAWQSMLTELNAALLEQSGEGK